MKFLPRPAFYKALLLTFLFFRAPSLFAQTPSFVTFDAPDAGTVSSQGTQPISINSKGVIAGNYVDSIGQTHCFVRDTAGKITEFDPPGSVNNNVLGINSRGQIIGSGTQGSFLRTINGQVFHIHVTGAVATQPNGINDLGQIAGSYDDAAVSIHGFLRDADGSYTLFDDPDALSTGGTVPLAINNDGEIAGYYHSQSTGTTRAFIRDKFGNFTNFDPVNETVDSVQSIAINLSGEISGRYVTPEKSVGFFRDSSGNIVHYSVSSVKNTFPAAINDAGVVVGYWDNPSTGVHGFTRDASGHISTFSAPVSNHGIWGNSINNTGRITGYYTDTNGVFHGFVR